MERLKLGHLSIETAALNGIRRGFFGKAIVSIKRGPYQMPFCLLFIPSIAYMSALNSIKGICRVRGISFPVAETHINPDKTLLNKSKTVKQLVWLHAVCVIEFMAYLLSFGFG